MPQRGRTRLPSAVKKLARQLQSHRRMRGKGQRIPEEIWQSAALLAQEHGVSMVVRSLGLDYYSLKERALGAESEVAVPSWSSVPLTLPALGVPGSCNWRAPAVTR